MASILQPLNGSHQPLLLCSSFISSISDAIWSSGVICIAIASLCYSIAASLVHSLSPEIGVFQIVATRSSLSILLTLVAVSFSSQTGPLFGQPRNMPFLAMRGILGSASMDWSYMALRALPLGDAQALIFFAPALTALVAWVVLHEALMWRGISGVVISALGMVLVVRPPFLFGSGRALASALASEESFPGDFPAAGSSGSDSLLESTEWRSQRFWGTIFGLSSACLAAVTYTTLRIIGKKESSLTIALWFHLTAVAHSSTILATGWPVAAVWPTLRDWGFMSVIAVCSFLANILLNRGFQVENAALVSGVKLTQLLYSHLIGIIIFKEKEEWSGIVGALCIAGGVFAVAMDKKQKAFKESEAAKELVGRSSPSSPSEVQLLSNHDVMGAVSSNDASSNDVERVMEQLGDAVEDEKARLLEGGPSGASAEQWRQLSLKKGGQKVH